VAQSPVPEIAFPAPFKRLSRGGLCIAEKGIAEKITADLRTAAYLCFFYIRANQAP
jgi:hypothetical protein